MFEKYLSENANRQKPITTFTEFIHPPDFGNFLSQFGAIAKIVNGKAKPSPKPSIPIVGSSTFPLAAFTNKAPTIGPVQLKLTITVVSARKNDAKIPPLSTCLSLLFASEVGRIISNKPNSEAANATNSRKNIKFGIQCVLSTVVSPAPAFVSDTITPIKV